MMAVSSMLSTNMELLQTVIFQDFPCKNGQVQYFSQPCNEFIKFNAFPVQAETLNDELMKLQHSQFTNSIYW